MCTCSTSIYTYYLNPHCLGCARNDVDIFTDDLTNKAHNNNNNNNNNNNTNTDTDTDTDTATDTDTDTDTDNKTLLRNSLKITQVFL